MIINKDLSLNTGLLIENSEAELNILKVKLEEIPVVCESVKSQNRSYVTSLLTQYILYTREEVLKSHKYSANQKRLAKFISPVFFQIAKAFIGNDLVSVNNNLTSTPLYNGKWDFYDIDKLSTFLAGYYKNKFIMFKSVEPKTNPSLFKTFVDLNFIPILGRQVYIFDPETSDYKKKRSFQMDKKLAEKQERFFWTDLDLDHEKDIERVLELYEKLYLEKHSIYNPKYTKRFITKGLGRFKLHFEVLKDKKDGKIVAVQGIHETEKVINTSFIGYDQDLPKRLGLYRLLNYELMRQAIQKRKLLNMSSGAGDFKLKRGAEASFEYQMLYAGNLSNVQKSIWHYLSDALDKNAKKQMKALKV